MSCSSAAASIALSVLIVADAERPRQPDRVRLHAPHVTVRHVVFGVDRHRERLDGREIQPIQVAEMPPGVVETAERRPQRQMEDGQQRQTTMIGREADLLDQKDEAERHRRRGEVADREPEEMLAPDLRIGRLASRPIATAVKPELSAK